MQAQKAFLEQMPSIPQVQYWRMLGTPEQIEDAAKKAWNMLSLRCHPDKHPKNSELAHQVQQRIGQALKDAVKELRHEPSRDFPYEGAGTSFDGVAFRSPSKRYFPTRPYQQHVDEAFADVQTWSKKRCGSTARNGPLPSPRTRRCIWMAGDLECLYTTIFITGVHFMTTAQRLLGSDTGTQVGSETSSHSIAIWRKRAAGGSLSSRTPVRRSMRG